MNIISTLFDRKYINRNFLLMAATTLTGVGVLYGVSPDTTIPKVLDIDGLNTDLRHIFRAIMGLYLTTAGFWAFAAFSSSLQKSAIFSVILFNVGLAAGRLLSFVEDGSPSILLSAYFLIEVIGLTLGIVVWRQNNQNINS